MQPKELRRALSQLPEIKVSCFWDSIRNQIRELGQFRDPHSLLRWSPILQTINVGDSAYIEKIEWLAVKNTKFDIAIQSITQKLQGKLEYIPDLFNNLVHQAYHLNHWETKTGKKVEDLRRVLEIGGGIGIMLMLVRELNPNCNYMIFDLLEMNLLQQFVYELYDPKEKTHGFDGWTEFVSGDAPGEFDKMPFDLTLSMWALSEIPSLERRTAILENLESHHLLFAIQESHEGTENHKWFREAFKQYDLITDAIAHLPGNSMYMIGVSE